MALVVVSLLSGRLLYFAHTETRLAAAARDVADADVAAEGAVRVAVFQLLLAGPTRRVSQGNEFQGGDSQGAFHLVLPNGRATIRFGDLAGRVNLNLASFRLLFALLAELGAGGETARATAAGLVAGRGPADGAGPARPFQDLADAARRTGIDPAVVALLSPYVTTWWRGPPDPRLADPAVRNALIQAGEEDIAGATQREERSLAIEATVRLTTGRVAVRRAVVRLGLGDDGSSWRFLAWDPPRWDPPWHPASTPP